MILASTRLITLRHFPRPLIGMEQFLCFFTEGAAEKFRIEGFDLRIAMTEAQGHFLVKGIETLTARFGSLFIIDGNRLATAAAAAAGAGHHFHEVIMDFSCFDGFQQVPRVAKTAYNAQCTSAPPKV